MTELRLQLLLWPLFCRITRTNTPRNLASNAHAQAAKLGQHFANIGETWPALGRIWPLLAQVWPNLTELGQVFAESGGLRVRTKQIRGRLQTNFGTGQIWPIPGNIRRIRTAFGSLQPVSPESVGASRAKAPLVAAPPRHRRTPLPRWIRGRVGVTPGSSGRRSWGRSGVRLGSIQSGANVGCIRVSVEGRCGAVAGSTRGRPDIGLGQSVVLSALCGLLEPVALGPLVPPPVGPLPHLNISDVVDRPRSRLKPRRVKWRCGSGEMRSIDPHPNLKPRATGAAVAWLAARRVVT